MSQVQFTSEADAVFTLTLTRPILAYGQQVETISFREPRAGDITRWGKPVNHTPGFDFDQITFAEAKMTNMLAALSGVPAPSIDTMTAQDWTDCAWGIARFFLTGMPRTPAAPRANSPASTGAPPSNS